MTAAIISAHEIVRTGLVGMFDTRPGSVEVIELEPGAPDHRQPDVILYDVYGLHDGDGDDLDRFVKDHDSAVVAMARDLRPDLAARAVAKGVDACVTLAVCIDDILEVIRSAVAGEGQPDVDGHGQRRLGRVRRVGRGRRAHAPRDRDPAGLLTLGLSNQQIADECFLSINSVKSYIRSAYRRIGVTSRSQAVLWVHPAPGFELPGEDTETV